MTRVSQPASAPPRLLPRGRHKLDPRIVSASQRARLLEAVAEVTAEKGYAAVTIEDIVRRAGTAKRTFYEHFDDKLACFLAALDAFTQEVQTEILREFRQPGSIRERVNGGLRAFVQVLVRRPAQAHSYVIEVLAAGPQGIQRRLERHYAYADLIVRLSREARRDNPQVRAVTRSHALAVIGAVNEAIYRTLHEQGATGLAALADELAPLVTAFLTAVPEKPARSRAR